MKLYEMTEQFAKLEEMAFEVNSPEDANAFALLWEEISMSFDKKAENTAMVIRGLQCEIDAIKAEEVRLYERRYTINVNAYRLKDYVEHNMRKLGIDKIKGDVFTLSIQKNPPCLEVVREELPDDYWVIERKPDNARIKDLLKEGVEIPGCSLSQGSSLRIK